MIGMMALNEWQTHPGSIVAIVTQRFDQNGRNTSRLQDSIEGHMQSYVN
jgi:hypothetical protein